MRRQVGAHRDRADAGAAAAVRDAEGLVEVEVGHVGAEPPRLGEPDERVEVGAVDVDLAAGVVDELAQLGDGVLVDAVRRGVRDHDRGEVVAVRVDLGAQVVHVDRAVVRAVLTTTTLSPGHDGRRGVGAVGARRDEADPAVTLTAGLVVGVDREQPGELALRPGVGLERHGVVAGDLAQPLRRARR